MYIFLVLIFLFASPVFAQLKISEIMYNPEKGDQGREWIEIFNDSQNSLEIKGGRSGWIINDGKNHQFKGNLVINPKEIFVIVQDKNLFLNDYPNFKNKLIEANFSLKNEEGKIQIFNNQKQLITEISYNENCGGNGNGYSIIFLNNICQESKIKNGTPGELEIIRNEINNSKNINNQNSFLNQNDSLNQNNNLIENFLREIVKNEDKKEINNNINQTSTFEDLPNITITEFLPNPEGKDENNEFVEIFNNSHNKINLNEIFLKIGNKKIKLTGYLEPFEYLVIDNNKNNFSIRNKGETISLFYKEKEIFKISYQGKAPSGKSFSRLGNNFWQFTKPTPGRENIFEEDNNLDKANLKLNNKELNELNKDYLIKENYLPTLTANIKQNPIIENYFFIFLSIIFSSILVVAIFRKFIENK